MKKSNEELLSNIDKTLDQLNNLETSCKREVTEITKDSFFTHQLHLQDLLHLKNGREATPDLPCNIPPHFSQRSTPAKSEKLSSKDPQNKSLFALRKIYRSTTPRIGKNRRKKSD